jgi:hypothetical protein
MSKAITHLCSFRLERAMLCVSCKTISEVSSPRCPGCEEEGSMINLARLVAPDPRRGQVTFLRGPQLARFFSDTVPIDQL